MLATVGADPMYLINPPDVTQSAGRLGEVAKTSFEKEPELIVYRPPAERATGAKDTQRKALCRGEFKATVEVTNTVLGTVVVTRLMVFVEVKPVPLSKAPSPLTTIAAFVMKTQPVGLRVVEPR